MLDPIRDRRSIRFFRTDPVSDKDLNTIIHAGFCAPAAHGRKPWHVVVIRDRALREDIAATHKWTRQVARAPISLLVCVDKTELETFWIEDGSAFIENVLLQAVSVGLGACWVAVRGVIIDGVDFEQKLRDLCRVPEHLGVLALVPVGYPARHPGPHTDTFPTDRVNTDVFAIETNLNREM